MPPPLPGKWARERAEQRNEQTKKDGKDGGEKIAKNLEKISQKLLTSKCECAIIRP